MCSHWRSVTDAWWKEHNPNQKCWHWLWHFICAALFQRYPAEHGPQVISAYPSAEWEGYLEDFKFDSSCLQLSPNFPLPSPGVSAQFTLCTFELTLFCTPVLFALLRTLFIFHYVSGEREKRACSRETKHKGITTPQCIQKEILIMLSLIFSLR